MWKGEKSVCDKVIEWESETGRDTLKEGTERDKQRQKETKGHDKGEHDYCGVETKEQYL